MIRRKVLSLLLTAALLFSSCGVPNYFDYTTDVSFKTQNISQADGRAAIYLDPSILDRIYDGALTPIPTTPKIYLLYSISGSADSSSSSLISAFNSAYRSSINSYPSEYEDFITRNVAPSAGADTVQVQVHKDDVKVVGQTGGEWVYVGEYTLPRGREAYVEISNQGADNVVAADAVLFLPIP